MLAAERTKWRPAAPSTPTGYLSPRLLGILALLPGGALGALRRNALARTPPMGWNSWGHFKGGVSAELLAEVADAMVALGLRDVGCESALGAAVVCRSLSHGKRLGVAACRR